MVALADYGDLAPGLYELQNCEIVGSFILSQGQDQPEDWFQFGDCDSARIEISATKINRKGRNKRVRTVVLETTTDVTATLAIRAMQYSDNIRSIALLGTAVPHTQAAVAAGSFGVKSAKIGGIYYVGALDISAVTASAGTFDAQTGEFTAGEALPAGSWKVVDEAAGGVQLLSGFADNDVIVIGYAAAAIAEADKRTRIDFGVETEKVMRLKIRGLSAQGTPFIFELNRWNGTPSGIDLIGGDDFSGQDLTGTLAAVGGKIGTWQKLSV